MKILKTSIDNFDGEIIDEAINVLADGGIVLYPTDTVYGLGANIFDKKAVKRVFEIKQRSPQNPQRRLRRLKLRPYLRPRSLSLPRQSPR